MKRGLIKITNIRENCDMVVSVAASPAPCLHLPIFSVIPSTEPPDGSILKEGPQLESCMLASKTWAILAETPESCKEVSNNFNNAKRDKNGGIQKFGPGLKERTSMDKQEDIVTMSDQLPNITRAKNGNYAKVKESRKTVSPACISILPLQRQAQSTDTDSRIITTNVKFKSMANSVAQNYRKCGANMKKFQHNKTVNHQDISNQ